ncbi:hypothetical protein KR52_03790 [Synechococcus sp. KORDI-52]|nr:hypothetical protein KR52_03790 [Synechococcus sp. KORDI-52]
MKRLSDVADRQFNRIKCREPLERGSSNGTHRPGRLSIILEQRNMLSRPETD